MSLLDKASLVITPNAVKAGKLYSVVPNTTLGDMDVVRGTTATRVNSAGLIESVGVNIPRIDYTNGSCPSLLVEPQRTNLALNSDGNLSTYFSINTTNASSSFNSFANAIQFPSTALALAYKVVSTTVQTYAISAFIKMDDNSVPILSASQTTGNVCLVIAGAVATNNLKVESYGNNVYRLSATATSAGINANNGVLRYDTQVLKSFKITGIQLEAASYPTSYIPTVASIQSRNADVISKTGISSLIGQTEGTLFVDIYIRDRNNQISASIQRDGGVNAIYISQLNSKANFIVIASNSSKLSYSNEAFLIGRNKAAITYNINGTFKVFLNGVKLTQTSISSFTFSNALSSLQLYDDGYYSLSNTSYNNSTQLYKTALTDTECITLTTL